MAWLNVVGIHKHFANMKWVNCYLKSKCRTMWECKFPLYSVPLMTLWHGYFWDKQSFCLEINYLQSDCEERIRIQTDAWLRKMQRTLRDDFLVPNLMLGNNLTYQGKWILINLRETGKGGVWNMRVRNIVAHYCHSLSCNLKFHHLQLISDVCPASKLCSRQQGRDFYSCSTSVLSSLFSFFSFFLYLQWSSWILFSTRRFH